MMRKTSQMVELEHTLIFHKRILRAIERRDAEGAKRLMTEHLVDAKNLLAHSNEQANNKTLLRHLASPIARRPARSRAPRKPGR